MNSRNSQMQESGKQFYQREEQLDNYMVKEYFKPSQMAPVQNPSLDFGTFNEFKLDDLINLQSDGFSEGKAVRLAFVESNSIHLQEEAIELFERYGKSELCFVGLYGRSGAGKSLLLDKIVNLCQFSGSYFSSSDNHQKGLYLWSVPLSRGSLKIFLMDMDGYDTKMDQSYFMLLDFMMLISSSVLFLASPGDSSFDELGKICRHVKKSRGRFKTRQEMQDTFWPNNMYCLFRRPIAITKGLQSIIRLFNEFNFTVIGDAMDERVSRDFSNGDLRGVQLKKYGLNKKILSEEYIKRVSWLIRDVVFRVQLKCYGGLRFTGANLVKLAVNAAQYLNLRGYLNVDKIFSKSMKELYVEAYNFHTQLYNQSLIGYLNEEEPMEVDYLLKAFQKSSESVLMSFNGLRVNEELKEQYSAKLQKYMSEKERMILEINKKKSKNKAKITVPDLPSKPELNELAEFIAIAKKAPRSFQQVYVQELAPQLSVGMKNIERGVNKEEKKLRQKSAEYLRKIQARSRELQAIQKAKAQKSSEITKTLAMKSSYQSKEKQLNEVLMTLKSQVKESKAVQMPKNIQLEKTKSLDMLKSEEMALRREKERKERMISQLKAQPDAQKNKEAIQFLSSKITDKISQQRELQNILTSQMRVPTVQVLRSTTSLSSPRKVQSRVFNHPNSNIRITPSAKG